MVPLPTRFSSSFAGLNFHFLPWQLDKSGPEGDHTPLDWHNQVAFVPLAHVFTETEPAGVNGQAMPRWATAPHPRIVFSVVLLVILGRNV